MLNLFQRGVGLKLDYETKSLDNLSFRSLIEHDFETAGLIELDGFGHLNLSYHDGTAIKYYLRGNELFRNDALINSVYGVQVTSILSMFENEVTLRDGLVDYVLLTYSDSFGREHQMNFYKLYGKADLYNYFIKKR